MKSVISVVLKAILRYMRHDLWILKTDSLHIVEEGQESVLSTTISTIGYSTL